MYIKKDDKVMVTAGRDKGKVGKVLSVDREKGTVIVEGANLVSKIIRRRTQEEQNRIISIEAPLDVSKVALVAKDGKPTRVGFKVEGDKKVRYSKRTGEAI